MLPRLTDQVVYTPRFWLSGNSDDLFPTLLTVAPVGSSPSLNSSDPASCAHNNGVNNDHCTSRAYQKMHALLDSAPDTSHDDWNFIAREKTFTRVVQVYEYIETWARISHVATGTVWIDGVQDVDAVTAGIVILAPLTSSNDTSWSALGCSIDARWDQSHHVKFDGPLDIAISADVIGPRRDNSGGSGFLPSNSSDWKNVKANMDWLEALTPIVPSLPSTSDLSDSTSTIADLLTGTNHTQFSPIDSIKDGYGVSSGLSPYQFWEFLLATYFAEGVACVGYSEQLDSAVFYVDGSHPGTNNCVEYIPIPSHNVSKYPEDRPKGASLTNFHIEGKRIGIYAYNASVKMDFISITIILVYLLIASAHLLYTLILRRSSQAWRSPDDLLALAHSSRPEPRVLSNTCAGMENTHVKARRVKILKRNKTADGDKESGEEGREYFGREEEQVQMVFVDSVPHDSTVLGRVEAGEKYGKMD
ncbi:MAG: hypothetical protein Q9167_003454 [Letrouitia subvulpina]